MTDKDYKNEMEQLINEMSDSEWERKYIIKKNNLKEWANTK
jgi:hypothetical protein